MMQEHHSAWAAPLFGLLLASFTLGACTSNGGTNADASHDYLTFDVSFGDLPPGCPPAAANDKGIGGACTMGGHECTGDLICACEPHLGVQPPQGTPCVCTRLFAVPDSGTVPDGYCGQDATSCSYMNALAICVPLACLQDATCPNI